MPVWTANQAKTAVCEDETGDFFRCGESMVSLYGILNIGARGVQAAQAGLDTTGHNLTNANTEGYTRQRNVQRTVDPIALPSGVFGQGVEVVSIERLRDQFMETQIRSARSDSSYYESLELIFHRIENILHDPLTAVAETSDQAGAGGLNNVLSRFFQAVHELTLNPEAPELRTGVVENARLLADTFNFTHDQLFALRNDLNGQVASMVQKINNLAGEIAALNKKVVSLRGQTVEANDYLDQRDRMLKQLSELVPVTTQTSPEGIVSVTLAGEMLVDFTTAKPLKIEVSRDTEGMDINSIRLNDTGLNILDGTVRKGELGALLEARDRIIPLLSGKLDTLANGIIREVNRIHSGASGVEGYSEVRSAFEIPAGADAPRTSYTLEAIFNQGRGVRNVRQKELFPIQDGSFSIRIGDEKNNTRNTYDIRVNKNDTLYDLTERIDRSDGVVRKARSALTFDPVFVKAVHATYGVRKTDLEIPLSLLPLAQGTPISETGGMYSFELHIRDSMGNPVDADRSTSDSDPFVVTFSDTDTLADLANAIQAAGNGLIRAHVVPSDTDATMSVLRIEALAPGAGFSIRNDNSGIIQAMDFPMTDPTLPLTGGTATVATSAFAGAETDSFLGTGGPNFSPAFPGPPPSVISSGTFEFVVIDNRNQPVINTITIGAGNVESMDDLRAALAAADPNLNVTISNGELQISSTNHRSFFFQNDTTGLLKALGFHDLNGFGSLAGQPFTEGSFEIVVASDAGTVTNIFTVPVSADPSTPGGVPSLQSIVDSINSAASSAGAPVSASIVPDPHDPGRSQLQVETRNGYEFTFRSDDSLLLSALGFTAGPVLEKTGNNPLLAASDTVKIGDSIGGLVRAHLEAEEGLVITTTGHDQISFAGDSSYFLSAARINSLFHGSNAQSMRVNQEIVENVNLLAASGDGRAGNNDAAVQLAQLEDLAVINGKTIGEFYRTTIALLGAEGEKIRQSHLTNQTILRELNALQESNSGVSLDEESINIIKFQQAFQASAKMITTVDRLLDLVINQLGR
ncbi:MAG: flagellar hook-associated protein FlgK [bacterium]|jgi:flagellar hook-associated protein FlgK